MSDGDDAADDESAPEDGADGAADAPADADEPDSAESPDLDRETFEQRLAEASEALAAAETEADLDDVAATLSAIADDLAAAELPEPDDEDEPAPADEIADELADLEERIEDERGPYAEDVLDELEAATEPLSGTRWTEPGARQLRVAVARFLGTAAVALDGFDPDPIALEPAAVDELEGAGAEGDDGGEEDAGGPAAIESAADPSAVVEAVDDPDDATDADALVEALDAVAAAIESADLDPDDDGDALGALLAAAEALAAGVEGAEEFADLSVRDQLRTEGFYDVIGEKHKDFPPEWTALKGWEQRDDAEMVLLALEALDSEFMERHCLEALERMGNTAAVDAMLSRAERRDKPAIRVLGTTGEAREDVLETLHEFVDGDPGLQRVTLRALGQIGSPESVQPVANQLVADDESVRSQAARSLGLLGDARAIEPLADLLDDADAADPVRASAAWALVQIGTAGALESAAEYADDDSYLVAAEAAPAVTALEDGAVTA